VGGYYSNAISTEKPLLRDALKISGMGGNWW